LARKYSDKKDLERLKSVLELEEQPESVTRMEIFLRKKFHVTFKNSKIIGDSEEKLITL
jgi:hypothetical protein